MKFSKIVALGAIAFAAAAAHAGPTEISGYDASQQTQTLSFSGNGTHSYYIDLAAGTYTVDSTLAANTSFTDISDVWFSNSKDKKDSGKYDTSFSEVSSDSYAGAETFTLTSATRVYIDVVASTVGKNYPGYTGSLTISAVPEPATTALLLAGLGMIGFVGRRRRNKV